MKNFKSLSSILLLVLVLTSISSCKKDDPDDGPFDPPNISYDIDKPYVLTDVPYGSHTDQKMDMYLPANRNPNTTKVFVLIHGGGWNAGDKEHFNYVFDALKQYYPNHAIVNINYRLASWNSPAIPKQIQDIESALNHASSDKFNISKQYCLFGNSAGGHLAMLYGYRYNANNYVKAVINTVGPSYLADPYYTSNTSMYDVVGPHSFSTHPQLYYDASPVSWLSPSAPITISFYGDSDILVPTSQLDTLESALTNHGVVHYSTLYPGEGHGNWSQATSADYLLKVINFIDTHFN